MTFSLDNVRNKTNDEITKAIPLWAELYAFYHKEKNETPTTPTQVDVPLIPAVAKVTLSINENIGKEITEVWLHNANTTGNVPYKDDSSFWGLNVNESRDEWVNLLPGSNKGEGSKGLSYYLTEAHANDKKDCTCLVVKIGEKFYRIDFREGDSEDLNLLPIVRNNHYIFTIISVGENSGSEDKEDALDNIYQKIEYEMATWEDFILDMHYDSDGKYIGIGVSKKNHLKEEDILLPIQTNFTSTKIKTLLKNKKLEVNVKIENTETTLDNEVDLVFGEKWFLKIPYQEDFNEKELSITINYGEKHEFGPFHVRYGKLLEYFRIIDASWSASQTGSGTSGNQVFYALHNKGDLDNRVLDVKFVYKVGGDEEIEVGKFETNTVDDMSFKCDGFTLDPKSETGSFKMVYQGFGPTTTKFKDNGGDIENLVVRDQFIYDFEIDLSKQLNPYFDKEQSSNRVDRLRFRVPIVGTNKPGDFYKILFWGTSDDKDYSYEEFKKKVYSGLQKEEGRVKVEAFPQFELRGVPTDAGNSDVIDMSHFHAIFYLMSNIDDRKNPNVKSHWEKLNKIYKENIGQKGRTNGDTYYRLIVHCSHGDADKKYRLIGGSMDHSLIRDQLGPSWDKIIEVVMNFNLGFNAIKRAARYYRNINKIGQNLDFTDYTDKIQTGANLFGLREKNTNYWWLGTSAIFEDEIYESKKDIYNTTLTANILRSLKKMHGKHGVVGETKTYHEVPIMKKIKTEFYDYPVITFGVEYSKDLEIGPN